MKKRRVSDGAEDKEGREKKNEEEASSPCAVIEDRFEFRAPSLMESL